MALIRHIQSDDRSELVSLWSLRFQDSPAFIDWFFSERLCPAHSRCLVEDGRIVSVIHAWPIPLQIRGVVLPALMLSGVATLPGFEGRGYMRRLMSAVLRDARADGFPLVFHKPVDFAVYAAFSQLPCTETLVHRVQSGPEEPVFASAWDEEALLSVYRRATARYAGCAVRDQSAMRLKLADYRSDGARLIHTDGAYAVLFRQDGDWYGEEALAVEPLGYERLLGLLPRGTLVKLPPDTAVSGQLRPQNAMGAADVPALLSALCGDASLIMEVRDPMQPENCGVFDGCGRRSAAPPAIRLSAGELMQHLCGYKAFRSLTRQSCFCVDEY